MSDMFILPKPTPMTPEQAYEFLNEYMTFIIPDATSRILGQQSINENVLDVYSYWQDQRALMQWGNPQITMLKSGPRIMVFLVENIKIGDNPLAYTTSLYFWGLIIGGKNTVVTKKGFWKLSILEPRVIASNIFLPR